MITRLDLFKGLTFNIYMKNNDVYVNEYLIEKIGYPKISEREWDILISRLNKPKVSYIKLGEKYNITKQRTFQIYNSTLTKLKNRYVNHLLDLLYD